MKFDDSWVPAPEITVEQFSPTSNYLTPAVATVSKESQQKNNKSFLQLFATFAVVYLLAMSVLCLVFPQQRVILYACFFTLIILPTAFFFGHEAQDTTFTQKAIKELRERLESNLGTASEPVKTWLRSHNVTISDTTAENIVSTFWGLKDDLKTGLKGTVKEVPTIQFNDVAGDEYMLVAVDEKYKLLRTVG